MSIQNITNTNKSLILGTCSLLLTPIFFFYLIHFGKGNETNAIMIILLLLTILITLISVTGLFYTVLGLKGIKKFKNILAFLLNLFFPLILFLLLLANVLDIYAYIFNDF